MKLVFVVAILIVVNVSGQDTYESRNPMNWIELDEEMPFVYRNSSEFYRIRFNPVPKTTKEPPTTTTPTPPPYYPESVLHKTTTTTPSPPVIHIFTKDEIFKAIFSKRKQVYARMVWNNESQKTRIIKYYDLPPINITHIPTAYIRSTPLRNRTSATMEDLQVHPEYYLFISRQEIETAIDAYSAAEEALLDRVDPIIRMPKPKFEEVAAEYTPYNEEKRTYIYPRFPLSQIKQMIQFWVMNQTAEPYASIPFHPTRKTRPTKSKSTKTIKSTKTKTTTIAPGDSSTESTSVKPTNSKSKKKTKTTPATKSKTISTRRPKKTTTTTRRKKHSKSTTHKKKTSKISKEPSRKHHQTHHNSI